MPNLTIKTKLYIFATGISLLLIFLGLVSIYSLNNVNNKSIEISKMWIPRIAVSEQLNALTSDYRLGQYAHISAKSPEELAMVEQHLTKVSKQIDEKFAECKNLVREQRHKDDLALMQDDWHKFEKSSEEMFALSRQFKNDEAYKILMGSSRKTYDELNANILKFQEYNLNGGNQASADADTIYNTTVQTLTGIIILAIILLLITIMTFTKWLARRFTNLSIIVDKIAEGDLREKVIIASNDELGKVSLSVNKMLDNLLLLVGHIQKTSQQVAAASEELTASADQSAQATQQVAQSITDVSNWSIKQVDSVHMATSIMEQIASNVDSSNKMVTRMGTHSQEAVAAAQNGSTIIENAVTQMNNIETTVTESADVVTTLGQRSKEIGQIVDTIASIAGQTNLLALNAAIEAARAGEHGKGFAVVAEEVRKLAEQSQEAAQQIGELISTIQEDTNNAVTAMNSGTTEVRSGTEVVHNAGNSFKLILEMINDVNHQSIDVANSMRELSTGIKNIAGTAQDVETNSQQVAGEAQSVSAATEEQAASMEQIAASSRSLADLAQDLQAATTKFKI